MLLPPELIFIHQSAMGQVPASKSTKLNWFSIGQSYSGSNAQLNCFSNPKQISSLQMMEGFKKNSPMLET
jgi:hypothetical protein